MPDEPLQGTPPASTQRPPDEGQPDPPEPIAANPGAVIGEVQRMVVDRNGHLRPMAPIESMRELLGDSREVIREFTEEELAEIRAMPIAEKRKLAAELLFRGLTTDEASAIVGYPGTPEVRKWFNREPEEMREAMATATKKSALAILPKLWQKLVALADSPNQEIARRTILDLFRAAGVPLDQKDGSLTVNATNVQFTSMPLANLDKRIAELAKKLGPAAEAMVAREYEEQDGKHRGRAADPAAGGRAGSPGAGGTDAHTDSERKGA